MESAGTNSTTNNTATNNICRLCNERTSLYTCPRCEIGFCSSKCYKSDSHMDCSESFYKQNVQEELKSQESDPESRQKMLEILKRVHEEGWDNILDDSDTGDDEDSPLDSDDDETRDLETRLQNVNLDDPNELWSVLSAAERQEFEALLKNGEAEKFLPKWVPWWTRRLENKLVQFVEDEAKDAHSDLKYPAVMDVPLFNELQKASPCLPFNVTNVIYAYAYIALYYNGDCMNCADDAASVFLSICENMKNNEVFEDADSAIKSVVENIGKLNVDRLPCDEQTLTALKEAGTSILQGPSTEMKTIYVCTALSELHRLLTAARKEVSVRKNTSSHQEFTKKFSQRDSAVNLSKKSIFMCLKKLEYYLSWVKKYGAELL
ncbi:hypothetical protein DMN91_008495 [Ooceraea biroi]|uniref:HIT-type domain-containing protein n=1 Tax=Ooceraea biroi TaxID=2015173 RepID=A0A3L8DHY3_OOCBI|nr:zinc finger HIT domain-containing protein 2 [Ooceraea biroi]RLU19936.1 hypothetical protein DMN91_008495 [Ooceraea biroi]